MTVSTIKDVCALISGRYNDPATIINNFGVVKEVLDPLLNALVRELPAPNKDFYEPDKTEKLIRSFYEYREFEYGEKLLEWFLFVEDERAVRLAVELSKSIDNSFQSGPSAFRGISKIVFKWMRKKDAPWYWSIPEFREYLIRHLIMCEEGENLLPYYLQADYNAGWPTFQRAVREIIAQHDISMNDVIRDVNELFTTERLSDRADSEDIRERIRAMERSWFIGGIADILSSWIEIPRIPKLNQANISFVTTNSECNIAVGDEYTLLIKMYWKSDEEWGALKESVVPKLKLEGIQTVTDQDIAPIPWTAFEPIGERRGDVQDRACHIHLRLTSPVGRIHLSFFGIEEKVQDDVSLYIGDVPRYLNSAWLMREK